MNAHAAFAAALLTLGGVAQAQPASPAPPTNPSQNCTPDAGPGSPTVGSGQSNRNLSDKLASSNGVICPPGDVDPQIHKPAPGGGRTPVIPPPGSPGGDQNTIPK